MKILLGISSQTVQGISKYKMNSIILDRCFFNGYELGFSPCPLGVGEIKPQSTHCRNDVTMEAIENAIISVELEIEAGS